MTSVSIFEAKTNLSRYVSSVVNKDEAYIVIVRNGKPVAKIVPYDTDNHRIGMARGILPKMTSLEEFNDIDVSDFVGDGGLL